MWKNEKKKPRKENKNSPVIYHPGIRVFKILIYFFSSLFFYANTEDLLFNVRISESQLKQESKIIQSILIDFIF